MGKWANGTYQVINPEKYIGKKQPHYRSGWEHTFMRFCDNNPAILQWASESIHIPYVNPFTNKQTIYVPDFFVIYIDKDSKTHAEVIEIKPSTQSTLESARNQKEQAQAVLNMYKWQAAQAWCKANNLKFRIVTENEIFHQVSAR
jgi:hypothetical protein